MHLYEITMQKNQSIPMWVELFLWLVSAKQNDKNNKVFVEIRLGYWWTVFDRQNKHKSSSVLQLRLQLPQSKVWSYMSFGLTCLLVIHVLTQLAEKVFIRSVLSVFFSSPDLMIIHNIDGEWTNEKWAVCLQGSHVSKSMDRYSARY